MRAINHLVFDPDAHKYYVGTREIPSVTTILKGAGLIETRWYTDSGRSRGDAVHWKLALVDTLGAPPEDVDPTVVPFARAWLDFKRDTGARVLEVEQRVLWDDEARPFAGTLDRILLLRTGEEVLVDIKSGSPADWHMVQCAAYRKARGFQGRVGVVYVKKTGRYAFTLASPELAAQAAQAWEVALDAFYGRRDSC